MNALSAFILIPVLLIVLQCALFLYGGLRLLTWAGVLKQPYAGLEHTHVLVAGCFLFGLFWISIADVTPLFQAYKTYQNAHQAVTEPTLIQFARYFLLLLLIGLAYVCTVFFLSRVLLGFGKPWITILDGNMAAAMILGVSTLGMALVWREVATGILDYLTPRVLVFN